MKFDHNEMMKRFLPPMMEVEHLSVADGLDALYGDGPSPVKKAIARHLAAAEIGGFLIFDDGSEVVA